MAVNYFGGSGLILNSAGDIAVDRSGLATGRCTFSMPRGRWDLVPAKKSAHPFAAWLGLDSSRVSFTKGFWTLVCEYAGTQHDGVSAAEAVYELNVGTGSEPIQTHPRFVTAIGGKPSAPLNGAQFVDERGDPTQDDNKGTFSKFSMLVAGNQNPLAGADSYLEANSITWTKSWTSKTRPSDGGDVGKIDAPEGGPPDFGGTRNWLYLGMAATERGTASENKKTWRLSSLGGWKPVIYAPNP